MTITGEESEGIPLGFTPPHAPAQPEEYPQKPTVTIRPQQGQADTRSPMNFQAGSGFNPGDSLANPVVPDLDEMAEMDEAKVDLPRQLEDHCKWLEEKFKTIKTADYRYGVDAKDLSLVPNLFSRAQIKTWKDLAQAFMKQYGHVANIAPDRITLQIMEKKPSESFRQYAQRWREVAMQVQPPLLEKKTTMLFINTLKAPFITHMIGSTTKSFVDILMAGEMIENAIRGGKIEAGKNARRAAHRKKDSEVNNMSTYNKGYSKPLQPPYLKWYDSNAHYDYHVGIAGNSIENCTAFKRVVERLIKMGVVKLDDTPGAENPLPNHGDKGINVIGEKVNRNINGDISEVKTSLRIVWSEMVRRGLIESDSVKGCGKTRDYCEFHKAKGHEIQECVEFRILVQSLMDNKELEFYEECLKRGNIHIIEGELTKQEVNYPRIIISRPRNTEGGAQVVPKVVIQKPISFPYKDNKRVLWNYICNVTIPRVESSVTTFEEVQNEGFYIRSGKRYDPENVRAEPVKSKTVAVEREKEFLKFLKHSEYSVMEQLRKQPVRISVLALLLSSEVHREALMKVLNETYVTKDIYVNKLDRLFSHESMPERTLLQLLVVKALDSFGGSSTIVAAPKTKTGNGESPRNEVPVPKISRTTRMGLQMMIGKGALPGKGLGKHLQGKVQVSMLKEKRDRFGLGFKPDAKQMKEEIEKKSLDINDMSNDTIDPEVHFEQDMCSEESQDFEGDRDCDLPPDLLRMVKQEEKQILPHEEEVENIALEEGNMVKIGTRIAEETIQDLVELLREFNDVFAWSYEDMPGLSTDIVVKYSEWVANIVPVPKKDGKVQMCVDYRDLNKASPKDNFPLPHIDTLVDNTAGYSLLKNAGATYQRAMVTLFHDMMHKEIEVYVDDMIDKSRTEKEHIEVLKKLFLRLKKFQMKLNSAKCTFGARSGKFLGFVVSERGIKVDSNKLTEKCDPIFCLLKKHNQGVWDEEYQSTFNKVKQYLTNAPVLSPPNPDRPLILFLLRQYMLYHTTWLISKLDPLKYMMEPTALNGRMARWQILLSEFDIVYVNQKAIKGSAIAEFLASRALEDYEPLSFEFPKEELMYVATAKKCPWKLNFDGASNVVGNGIGTILVSPNDDHYPFTCKLDFDYTNNMAEYEACIMGIRAAIERKIRFDDITFNYLPRNENQMADVLATLASMIKVNRPEDMRPIQISILEVPAHCYNVEEEERDDHPWYHDVLQYVKNREYPEHATKNEKKDTKKIGL
ncbi:Retrovirus-related Pol polyprotein from transposon 17.6 [Gossypium australe]|uniref:Retrovirus-related Pol polyprotein from transposon 17.6 n=1 Tax=Gossypium australe TaxID=47621 RepID=A0A5B6UCX0_9ROSI|nr:Retrovirus-related Pol polyprotein from transposon 17.6 [Gossypium australe]